jgi:signal transduction histidine kinase
VRLAAAFLVAVPVGEVLFGSFAPSGVGESASYGIRLLIEGGAFAWAASTPALARRVRGVLLALGLVSLVAGLLDLVTAGALAVGLPAVPQAVMVAVATGSYLFSIVQLWLPTARLNRGERTVFVLDMLISIGGISALFWVLVTRPPEVAGGGPGWLVIGYGIGQIVQLAGPTVLVTRGVGYPSRRALWLLIAGQAAYVPVLLLAQYYESGVIRGTGVIDAIYFTSVIFTLLAAVAYRTDIPDETSERLVPAFALINPFVLATPLLVSGALLAAIYSGATAQVSPLAHLLAAIALLLVLRNWRSEAERSRLIAAESGEMARLAASKNAALGRLAGGIAHEFNNLMQVVIGHADLASSVAPARSPLRADLSQIRTAAERAALLTSQLLHFSGRQVKRQHRLDLAASVKAAELEDMLPTDISVEFDLATVPPIHADPVQIRQLVGELVSNARDAMPRGGHLHVSVKEARVDGPMPGAVLLVSPGRYAVIEVRDTGLGIPPEAVSEVFEPFYSTKREKGRAGLGLAAVYGIVASHQGGIAVEAAAEGGTRVRVFFPCAASEARAAAAS